MYAIILITAFFIIEMSIFYLCNGKGGVLIKIFNQKFIHIFKVHFVKSLFIHFVTQMILIYYITVAQLVYILT